MTNAIVEKLRQHLSDVIDTECKVVYLLCEIRKLLDKKTTDPKLLALRQLFALRLYCNWAVHVDLSQNTTVVFLKKVDSFFLKPTFPSHDIETTELFREFVYLETFRKELSRVLSAYGLPTSLCDENERWFTFLTAYAGVIEDGSLTCKSKKPTELKMVKEVVFNKGRQNIPDSHVPFSIIWKILLKDGRTIEFEGGAPADASFLVWGFRLVQT